MWCPEERGEHNWRLRDAARSVDKGRGGEVEILSGVWIGIGGLNVSLSSTESYLELTELKSFAQPEEDTDDIRNEQYTAYI